MGKIVLGIIAFILITIIPVVIIGFAAQPLFYPDVYKTTFEKTGVYDKLPQILSSASGVEGLFTKDYIKTNVDRMLDNALAYLRGETNTLDLSIAIDRNQVRNALLQRVNSIPECPAGVLPQNTQNPECFPAGVNRIQFVDSALNSVQIPEKLDLLQPQMKGGIDQIRDKVKFFYNVLYGLLALTVILLLLMVFLTRHSTKSMAKWLGSTLLIAGVTVLVISFILTSIVVSAVASQVGSSSVPLPLISGILDAFADSMRTYSIAIVVIGAVLYAASWKMKDAKKKK